MKVKTSELTGATLDWAVAKCEEGEDLAEGWHPHTWVRGGQRELRGTPYSPSTDWAQAGPIIERERIAVTVTPGSWAAYVSDGEHLVNGVPALKWKHKAIGPTPLIAAMRAFVASKLGDEVDVPEELQ